MGFKTHELLIDFDAKRRGLERYERVFRLIRAAISNVYVVPKTYIKWKCKWQQTVIKIEALGAQGPFC